MEKQKNLFEEIFKITYPIPVKIPLDCFDNNKNAFKVSSWEFYGFRENIYLVFKLTDFKDSEQYLEIKNKFMIFFLLTMIF